MRTRHLTLRFTLVGAMLALMLAAPTAQAVKRCKAKADAKGVIKVSFMGLNGTPLWGEEEGSETNSFANLLQCVTGSEGLNCLIAAKGTPESVTPPEECTLYLVDDGARSCSTWIKGCTPGVRLESEKSVKAWASVAANGTVIDCLNCDALGTSRTAVGTYTVDFSPRFTDLTAQPKMATVDAFSTTPAVGMISISDHATDTDSIVVNTQNQDGDPTDRSFTVMIY